MIKPKFKIGDLVQVIKCQGQTTSYFKGAIGRVIVHHDTLVEVEIISFLGEHLGIVLSFRPDDLRHHNKLQRLIYD